MNPIRITVALVIFAILILGFFSACCIRREMGGDSSEPEKTRFSKLKNYRAGKFLNEEAIELNVKKTAFSTRLLRHLIGSPTAPEDPIPQIMPVPEDFADTPDDFSVRWLGHSTLIFEIAGTRFITDPVFGNAAPVPLVVRRYCDPPLARDALPDLDFVLISHDHYDHLEYATIRALRTRKNLKFVTMLGVGAHLRAWDVPAEQIIELDWDETFSCNGVTITAQPARHFSGRTFGTRDATLWGSFVIAGAGKKVFFGGDSGYGAHFKKIGEKHGPFSLVCLEIDAWNPQWRQNHMFPHEAIVATRELRGELLLPIHWGVFNLAMHPWKESISTLKTLADTENLSLATPLMGEKIVPVPARIKTGAWWERLK